MAFIIAEDEMAGKNYIQSLERGMAVLQTVARADGGASLQTIALELGLKPPTAHNLVRTLVAHAWLERFERPVRYRLGSAVPELLREQAARLMLQAAAAALMKLQRSYPGGVLSLAESVGRDVLIVLRLAPERPGFLERPLGRALSAYASASPLLFQALWNDEQRADYRRSHPFAENGAVLWKTLASLDRFLAQVRAQGFVEVEFEGEALHKVAAPVFGPGAELRATLGLALPADGLGTQARRRIAAEITAAAAAVSRSMSEKAQRRE